MAHRTHAPPMVARRDLDVPEQLSRRRVRSRVAFALGLVVVVVLAVTLLPGLGELRSKLAHASVGWLLLGVGLKLLSGLGYVAVFRMIFCRRMSWRVSLQIGMSELGANALIPTGGAGGLALGAWALKRGGVHSEEIARRTVAFFLLTSLPNVLGVIVLGVGLALGALGGESNLLLTLLPAAIATGAIVLTLLAGRIARGWRARLDRSAGAAASRRRLVVVKSLTAIGDGVREALVLLREGNALLILGLLAYLVFDVMILWAAFRALGPAPPLAILWIAYLIGELGGLIPVPGGIGGVDAGLVGTFALYNVSLASAAGAVLAYRAIALWVPAVVGGGAFIALRRTLRDEAERIAVCVPQTEIDVIGLGRVVIAEHAEPGGGRGVSSSV
ncbi:MAG TPA: lysylphosphatidylglycerol synthase transmembrane domain-containing protein [Solirubrobacteraceae bacterium]|nr:lysylphosphatidylglycerol synthase transmembrane domain-containing protein [Solirubrobacteraceae bacterium]